jgi:dTDP-4-dehydrorhamnose reductase
MKTLITGAAGMLGTALRRGLAMDKTYKVYASDIDVSDNDMLYLDVRDFKQIESFMLRFKPDIVLHLAAETNVDKCQTETRHAYTANTLATENMALSCLRYNTPLVYISTAAVFDGKKKMSYTEFDEPNPLNIYAKTKWEGEKIVHSLLSRYYIIRAGWMIGGVDKDKKFVAKIFNLIKTKK